MLMKSLVLLCLLTCTLSAEVEYQITFTPTSDVIESDGSPYGQTLGLHATFTTDGTCTVCTATSDFTTVTSDGLLSFDIFDRNPFGPAGTLGPPSPLEGTITYNTLTNVFTGDLDSFGLQVYDFFADGSYRVDEDGVVAEVGSDSVSAVPEPSSWMDLPMILIVLWVADRLGRVRVKRAILGD
jgi:hypothetical protein